MRNAVVLGAFGQHETYVLGSFAAQCDPTTLHVWLDHPTTAGSPCCCGQRRFLESAGVCR